MKVKIQDLRFTILNPELQSEISKQRGNHYPYYNAFNEKKQKTRYAEAFNPSGEKIHLFSVLAFLHFNLKITCLLAHFKLSDYKFFLSL